MSYTNPKYTYVSQQPAFERMRQEMLQAGKTIADKNEVERKKGEVLDAQARGASQAFINKAVEYNSVGDQNTQSIVQKLFAGTGKRVGELTRLTSGPNPQCEIDGNCEQLMTELATLNSGPNTVKTFVENLSDQLDYSDIANFDPGQNSRAQQASNIFGGKMGFNPKDGYSYEMQSKGDGSYDIVFKYDGGEDGKGFFNPETGEYETEYRLNSAGLENVSANDGSIFNETPSTTNMMNTLVKEGNLFFGAEYNEDGSRVPGTGQYNLEQFKLEGETQTFTDSKGNVSYYEQIDGNKIKDKFKLPIAEQIEGFIGNVDDDLPGEQDAKARSYWNMVLSKEALNAFDEDLLVDVFGENYKTDGSLEKWDYNTPITTKQKKQFARLYEELMIKNIKHSMESELGNRQVSGVQQIEDWNPS